MQFIKVTVVGGVTFLVSVTVLIIILGKIASFLSKLVAPLAAWVPPDQVSFSRDNDRKMGAETPSGISGD